MILVTGGMGFIGLHTARALRDMGARVAVTRYRTDRLPSGMRGDPGIVSVPLDVADRDAFRAIGEQHPITGIVHLAAHLDTGDAVEAMRVALAGFANVIDAARAWRVGRVTLASTIGVYAGVTELPFHEDARLPIASPHLIPAVKKTWEILAVHLADRVGVELVVARLAGFWGPFKSSRNAMPSLLAHAAVRGGPLDFTALLFDRPGLEAGYDMIFAEDGARAIAAIQLAPALPHRTYNVGAGRVTRNRDLLAAVGAHVPGFTAELPADSDLGPPATMHLDTARLRALGWAPRFDLHTAMTSYIEWLRAGHPW